MLLLVGVMLVATMLLKEIKGGGVLNNGGSSYGCHYVVVVGA